MIISHLGELPSNTGLASSSAFTVGLLNNLYKLNKLKISKKKLFELAIYIEQKILKEKVGIQDQIAVAKGGLNFIRIKKNSNINISKIKISKIKKSKLENNLLLMFLDKTRFASEVEKSKNFNNILLKELLSLTDYAYQLLISNKLADIDEFGKNLTLTWKIKKELSKYVSNSYYDEIFETALNKGALGGKMLGAGGGGCFLFYVKLNDQQNFKKYFKKFKFIDFAFEDKGSNIIYSSF